MELVIGDKTLSSWSMRPWLVLKRARIPFTETLVRLNRPDTAGEIAKHSPAGKVPVLKDRGITVWDSLAIVEYVADRFPEAELWTVEQDRRALARSAAAEMHSGFASLRGECPVNLRLRQTREISAATGADVRRIVALWTDLRRRLGDAGPFLVGGWTIADAFHTPLATRFRSYGIELGDYGDDGAATAYAETLLATPEFLEWEEGALAEDGHDAPPA